MTLTVNDFDAFFSDLHDGHRPFAWQSRLLDHLLATGQWPAVIGAPTGAGKTAVIDVHVFACALMAVGAASRLPRRLALVVDRRVLVDSHDQHARQLAGHLAAPTSRVMQAVAAALRLLRNDPAGSQLPLLTARLRGGTPPPRSWRDDPESCLVLTATPDMWGSRLLLGGYGSSRRARSREAGLLAFDAVVVVDEAHLSPQLLRTARRVADLAVTAEEPLDTPALQVVETTATPETSAGDAVGVLDQDLTTDPVLLARLQRPKPLTELRLAVWPSTERTRPAAARTIGDHVAQRHDEAGRTVGCVLNRVADAVAIAQDLRARGKRVELLVGRLRPADITRLPAGLLTPHGNSDVDVLVATQTVEVGVDIDLAALVTDLAPGSALAQRAGRVNRRGLREDGPITVILPEADIPTDVAPYRSDDLATALEWLRGLPETGLSPWNARTWPPPAAARRRLLLQRLELADACVLSRTGDELFTAPDRELWLSEDLTPDRDVGLVVRRLPRDPADATAALNLLPPAPHEVFPVSRSVVRTLLEGWYGAGREDDGHTPGDSPAEPPVALLIRDGDVTPLATGEVNDAPHFGDIVVVDATAVITRAGVVDAAPDESADDVFESGPGASLRVGPHSMLPAAPGGPVASTLSWAREVATRASEGWSLPDKRELAQRLSTLPSSDEPPLTRAIELLRRGRAKDCAVEWLPEADRDHATLVVVDQRRTVADEDLRQTFSFAEEPVLLDQHQDAVGSRAAASGRQLGLPDPLVEALRLAGQHHDDGKADPRFQQMLGAHDALLAKSGRRSRSLELAARAGSGLPAGWRHEQLSALDAWEQLAGHPARALVTRLVGTSHGHGRVGFPHTAADLLPADDARAESARELFDVGHWDDLVEETDRHFGVWGIAYLEAIFRAADGSVSRSGS